MEAAAQSTLNPMLHEAAESKTSANSGVNQEGFSEKRDLENLQGRGERMPPAQVNATDESKIPTREQQPKGMTRIPLSSNRPTNQQA